MVSDLFMSPVRNVPIVTVAVPVIRDGHVTHLLMAALKLQWYDELLRKQGLPEAGGVGAIFDRQLKFVARSADGDQRRGGNPSEPLGEHMKAASEGVGRYPTLDGLESYTAWTKTRHGWTIGLATPAAPLAGVFWKHMLLFGSLWSAVLAAGIALALFKGKHITESLQSLETGAGQLAQGKSLPVLVSSRVAEVDQAKAALEKAGTVLARAMVEREHALGTERDARAAAEAANRAKDEFLAMLGHELRNPLAAISNAVTIVRSELHTPEQLKFAGDVIARQSQHLKRLIDDLLDVGRVMTGKIMISRSPLDLATSVRHVASTLRTAGRLTDRVIEIDAESAWVSGDPTRIEQIVTNLLVNAATYTAPGARIRVEVRGTQELATLRVTDNGIGISADNLPRVFDLFFQAEPTAERAHSGLGIGLTLVRRLVELHGGSVTAASEGKGKGAAFEVRLPTVPKAALSQSASAVTKPASRRVLIVEDNADERDSLRVALELQGHDVLQASNGLAALDVVRRERPPVAVIDIGLPGMDGYRLARTIRGEMQRGILLIALTGYGAESDARRALEAGFDLHLTKPVDVEDLATLVSPRKTGETAGLQGRSVG
jgi:signal transduction histidine kinase/CheY-like chemotaxis protein